MRVWTVPLTLAGLLLARPASAQCQQGVCVPREDMVVLAQLLRDQKCRNETVPQLKLDPVTIITDRQGRVYTSGTGPRPYKVELVWCNYTVKAEGQINVLAAQLAEPSWGWRFRVKATVGYLPLAGLSRGPLAGLDGGALFEPVYWRWLNANVFLGARSVGVGLGLDLTRNLGVYTGYSWTWDGRSQVLGAVSFALW